MSASVRSRLPYEQELRALEHDLMEMATRVEAMIAKSSDCLLTLDAELPFEVMQMDDAVDQLDAAIEERCLKVLALQQPMGADLREIGSFLKIVTDLERIGDLAVEIAKTSLKIGAEMGATSYVDVAKLSRLAHDMVVRAIEKMVRRDSSGIEEFMEMEERLDSMYRDVRAQIFDHMRSHPDAHVAASWLFTATQNIERVGDHALNVFERVIYMVDAKRVSLSQLAFERSVKTR